MTGGTNSVAMMAPKTIFLPLNSMRASGYAAMAAVATTRAEFAAAAIMLFANQRSTGVPEAPRMLEYAWVVKGFGIQLGGTLAASMRVLNDVTSMNSNGLMNSRARTARAM